MPFSHQAPSAKHIHSAFDLASAESRLMVFSPHFDDAVFSCGHLLADVQCSTVVTVYTGLPHNAEILTDWDQRCGFSSAGEAMTVRAAENRKALALLHASGINLEFLDSQYTPSRDNGSDLMGDILTSTIVQIQPTDVFFPLGLFHEDHIYVSDVLMTICHRFPAIHWFAYEDIPYCKRSQRVLTRLSVLPARGVTASPFRIECRPGRKAAAVAAYQSQFRGLGYEDGRPLLQLPERYWQLQCNMELL